MRLSPSDFFTLLRPISCDLRLYLRHKRVKESDPGPYDQVIRRLGERHEQNHKASFESIVDLRDGSRGEREHRTVEAVTHRKPVIYQPALSSLGRVANVDCEVVGDPDFLIRGGDGYRIRDCKISRKIDDVHHPEILHQMQVYGYLYERTFGSAPVGLEVLCATGDLIELEYGGGESALGLFDDVVPLKQASSEPYVPVGWSKCGGCPFHYRCWPSALKRRDAALVPGVDQGLARALRDEGIVTIRQLLDAFDAERLAQYKRPYGKGVKRVGRRAEPIITSARAMDTGEVIVLQRPAIPESPNYVVFDLEGLPAQLDDTEKIYLWGLQVFGENPGRYLPATAGFGGEGDRQGWEDFLENAGKILTEYPDIPFIHWAGYELSKLRLYVQRFGNRDGVADRVERNLLDLLAVTKQSLVLPLPSYSLKVVEDHIGFKRTQDEYGGTWAMAKYIEATETEDEALRQEVMDEILRYNEEDLKATWAVLQWLKGYA